VNGSVSAAGGDRLARWLRWRYVLGALGLALGAVLLGLWLARKPLAEHFIADTLRARGVPARYQIEKIGLRTQRLTNVVLGDPANPDLRADWLEVDTSLGFSGVGVTAVRIGHLAMRGRLADGKVSFGAIDRLQPQAAGTAFALPRIRVDIADARIALTTPYGALALATTGSGALDDGFSGRLRATSARLAVGGCRLDDVSADVAIQVLAARPSVSGPVRAARADCAGVQATGAAVDLDVVLNRQLDRWKGKAQLGIAAVARSGVGARTIMGPVSFAGSGKDLSGAVDLHSGPFAASGVAGRQAALTGAYRYANGGFTFDGDARAVAAQLSPARLTQLDSWQSASAGTPLGPMATQVVMATRSAARSVSVDARITATIGGAQGRVRMSRLALATASGVNLRASGAADITYGGARSGWRIAGAAEMAGGGLPEARVRVMQDAAGSPLIGQAIIKPYAVGTSQLVLAPVAFTARNDGATQVTTRIDVSGPLGDGRVESLRLPIVATWDGGSRLTVNATCAPLGFARLRLSGIDLRRSSMTLCPRDGGLARLERGVLRGGGGIGPIRLAGTLGASPLELVMRQAQWSLEDRRFVLAGLGVRVGTAERITRLDVARLAGAFAASRPQGSFDGAAGQIGSVPLLLSAANGNWRFAEGKLSLAGGLAVADSAASPRFHPMAVRGAAVTLADNHIVATGTLFEPKQGVKVADVTIAHDLGTGTGRADLIVPGITFDEHFQPDHLTPLTFGVIANVVGATSGEGHIRWTPQAVTSDGVFRTGGINLAAAFGPASGIAGEIRFTDLLNLESAPGQVATIKSLNPGVAVNDGVVRYQLLPGARVRVEQGVWPFAGGRLSLEPTLLDFDEAQERHLTFRVTGVQADQFLQQFDFKNLNATGIFDGALPMVFDARGGRIENGNLVVHPGGGTIAYVGEVTQKDLGFWGNFAFQSLKSLRYRNLDIVMNGPLAGEVITQVRFAGIAQGAGAKRNFLFDRLQKLPIVFNLRISAPFRQLADSVQNFYDPKRLVERNLPTLLEEQNKRAVPPTPATPIQPSDSRTVP